MAAQDLNVPAKAQGAFADMARYTRPAPLLVVISGPSGVGKDSVINRIRELGYPFEFVVTATDRPQRPNEVDGVDYYFVSTACFEQMIADGELFEHALVYGQYKGIPKRRVLQALASGVDVLMRLDVQGACTVQRIAPEALSIFLAPPSLDTLVARLSKRGADTPAQVEQRLAMALTEMRRLESFDYVVVNRENELDETVRQVIAIITAEKCRTVQRHVVIETPTEPNHR